MKMKCEYCGSMIDSTLDKCPNCGAANKNVVRVAKSTPKTIEELKEWYSAHNLPPSNVTRFFIGENYTGARAFGIYKDGDNYIVYKNKDTGERAIRYQGTDEAYAVNELYLKLKSEILNQKAGNANNRKKSWKEKFSTLMNRLFWVCFVVIFIAAAFGKLNRKPHYYQYDNTVYVDYHDNWYVYNDYAHDYYNVYTVPSSIQNNPADYEYDFKEYAWDDYSNFVEFKDSSYYRENIEPYESSSNSDSDYSWDSGSDSWDSGSTDWGSDW